MNKLVIYYIEINEFKTNLKVEYFFLFLLDRLFAYD